MSISVLRKITIHGMGRSHAYLSRFSSYAQPTVWTAADDAVKIANTTEEGNVWDDNFSIAEDGVVNTKLAFRNAKLSSIITRLPAKIASGKITLDTVNFDSKNAVLEAGDNLDQDEFSATLTNQHDYLSTEKDLFFEDVGLGASDAIRVGARMISENPAHALIFRSLMVLLLRHIVC